MAKKASSVPAPPAGIDLGENPVNNYHAREYARESSPSLIAVILELTENARDNGTEVTLTIDVADTRIEAGARVITPRRISCEDNGTGLSHAEFLGRFCGVFAESEAHHEVDRAGRNGVGTKTYLSIAERVVVRTTTARPTEGLDQHRDLLAAGLPAGLNLPRDGEPDALWRVYDFWLHRRGALPLEWTPADPLEMGTRVDLLDLRPGTEFRVETLIERLSYTREWLHNNAHSFTIQFTGNTGSLTSKRIVLEGWKHPNRSWLVEAAGKSSDEIAIYDPTTKEKNVIQPATDLKDVVEFDFRVVGKGSDGQMQTLDKPALLLEICGALPYPPNLEGVQSARTSPLLTFLGLEHASSIGAFYNSVCGYARVNSLRLKGQLRNNKTTLASGPGSEDVEALRAYLFKVMSQLHRSWYNATRSSQDEAANDALKEAAQEVNLALKGVNRNPFKGRDIRRDPDKGQPNTLPPPRRHRWECGACEKRWLADNGFTPTRCAESDASLDPRDGCGSTSIGLAKNQPRIGDCEIRVQQLGDRRLPADFQFEKVGDDVDLPVVYVNIASPRYVELRGSGSMSGQAQKRLKQYLVDVALVAIAAFNANVNGTDFAEELGDLHFNRMLRFMGIKQYESSVAKLLDSVAAEAAALTT